ncbi:MAG: enoyl-CoA hydratase/isomerase family protein [Candidatus Hodarchaeales archaeon]|jgi:enoyl-CoA hydratase/carnithine racemase
MSNEYECIKYEVKDQIGWLTFNRPEVRNAISRQTWKEITDVLESTWDDYTVRALVITGEGKAFSAGLDIKEMSTVGFKGLGEFLGVVLDPIELLQRYPKPVIAAVNGFAFAGGFELTLFCDLVIASEKAEFGFVENRRGLMSGLLLIRAHEYNMRYIKELTLTGRRVSAQELYRMGFVNKVVPHDQLEQAVIELCEEIKMCAPLSQKYTKENLRKGIREVGQLWEPFYAVFHSDDVIEGFTAWMEKRSPDWKGK